MIPHRTGRGPALMAPSGSVTLPPGLTPFSIAVFVLGGVGPNLELALLAIAVLLAGCALLWRRNDASVLCVSFIFGWLGAAISIFYANWFNTDVSQVAPFASDMNTAIALSLCGMLALAAGMRAGMGPQELRNAVSAQETALNVSTQTWFKTYLGGLALSFAAQSVTWFVPGLSQLFIGLASLKWAFYFVLAYASFVRRSTSYLTVAFAIEFLLGIGSFFSDFKTVFLVTMIAFAATGARLSLRTASVLGLLASAVLGLGVVWTAVKGEYRAFLASGSGTQAVQESYASGLVKLSELVSALDGQSLANGLDNLVQRLSYVEFFGAALLYVPRLEPHSEGAILIDAVMRPFTPRILFPGKAVIDDSQRTNQYTGGLAGEYGDTSISLGYAAESYIDFGMIGMFPALLAIGFVYGSLNRWLLRLGRCSSLWGNGLATATLIHVATLDNSFTKIFGGLVATAISAWLLTRYGLPRAFPHLLERRPAQ